MTKRNIGQRVLVVVTVTFNFVAYNFYLSFSSLIKNIFKNMNYLFFVNVIVLNEHNIFDIVFSCINFLMEKYKEIYVSNIDR